MGSPLQYIPINLLAIPFDEAYLIYVGAFFHILPVSLTKLFSACIVLPPSLIYRLFIPLVFLAGSSPLFFLLSPNLLGNPHLYLLSMPLIAWFQPWFDLLKACWSSPACPLHFFCLWFCSHPAASAFCFTPIVLLSCLLIFFPPPSFWPFVLIECRTSFLTSKCCLLPVPVFLSECNIIWNWKCWAFALKSKKLKIYEEQPHLKMTF